MGRLVGGLELMVAIIVLIAPREWRWTGDLAMTTLYLAFVGVVLPAVRNVLLMAFGHMGPSATNP